MKLLSLTAAALLLVTTNAFANTNILFIVDASGSMKEKVGDQTRMDAAKDVLGKTLGSMPEDANLGLLVYGHRKAKDCSDIELVSEIGKANAKTLQTTISGLTALGETPIADSLLRAAAEFEGGEGTTNKVILVTDGLEECKGDPCAAAQAIKNKGIDVAVDVVGFTLGAEEAKAVQCITETTGGTYYGAADVGELTKALEEAAAPKSTVLFEDTFTGDTLSDAWKVVEENDDAYATDEDGLYVVSKFRERKEDPFFVNTFALDRELPKGDFTVTVKMVHDFQQGDIYSGFMLGDDKDNYILSYFGRLMNYSHIEGAAQIKSGTYRENKGEETSEMQIVVATAEQAKLKGLMEVDLQFRREGKKISTFYKRAGVDQDWIAAGGEITVLKLKERPLSFVYGERWDRPGEANVTVKSFKIEVPADELEDAKARFTPLNYEPPQPEAEEGEAATE